jgi:hypothetical protein
MIKRSATLAGIAFFAAFLAACGDSSGPRIGPPASLTPVTGNGQSGAVATLLATPISVRVTDASGQPVRNTTVTFVVTSGGGSVNPATATTDATGTATTRWTLGTNASQEQRLEARVTGVTTPATFTAVAQPGPAATLIKSGGDAQLGPVGAPLTSELAVTVGDQFGNPVAGATVTWNVLSGGGTITPASSVSGADGVARARWTLGAQLNAQTASASVASVATVTFSATGQSGAVDTITLAPATTTVALGGTRQFTATLKDAFGNTITGRTISWSTSNPAVATVDNNGLARGVGAGTVQIIASLEGKSGTASLTVSSTPAADPTISGVQPGTIEAGSTATITGTNFASSASANTVAINGVNAVVTTASATQLTIQVPDRNALGCEPTRNVNVTVTVDGVTATRSHPLVTARQRTVATGQLLTISGEEARCNELSMAGGRYIMTVANTTGDASTVDSFVLRGAAAAAGLAGLPPVVAPSLRQLRAAPPSTFEQRRAAAAHARIQQNNLDLIRSMPRITATERAQAQAVASMAPPPNLGDTLTMRMADPTRLSCGTFLADIRARVVYVGERGVLLEDVAAPLAGTMDSLYRAVGVEFDNVMYPILTANFGDPLVFDASLDNNQRFFMLFTRRVNDMEGIAGYVLSTDFYPRAQCTSSNAGEVFYARVPTSTATGTGAGTKDNWLWATRTVIIHEAKHLVAFAARFAARNGNPTSADFEHTWLEEASAMTAEELWARAVYGYAQRGNVDYQRSIFCEIAILIPSRRVLPECINKPRSMLDHFALLHDFELDIENFSPLGRATSDDFTFYGSGWALLRWAIDHSSQSESAFLRALTSDFTNHGVANLQARTGRTFPDMLVDWTLTLALDDRSGFTPPRTQLTMPGWNLPDIFAGLARELQGFETIPLRRRMVSFGDFNVSVPVLRGGTASIFELSGTQAGKQLLELRNSTGGAVSSSLRFSIIRVE